MKVMPCKLEKIRIETAPIMLDRSAARCGEAWEHACEVRALDPLTVAGSERPLSSR